MAMALPQYTLSGGGPLNYLTYFSRVSTYAITYSTPLALTLVPSPSIANPLITGTFCYITAEIFNTNYLTVEESGGKYWAYWVNSQSDATAWQLFVNTERSTGKQITMQSFVQVYSPGSAYGAGYIGSSSDPPYVGWAGTSNGADAGQWWIDAYDGDRAA